MADTTRIEWTQSTFNPWVGCVKVSEGCAHCYAEVSTPARRSRAQELPLWGPDAARRMTSADYWKQPYQWDRQAAKAGEQRRVFCASLADVFEGYGGQMIGKDGLPLWWRVGGDSLCQCAERPGPDWEPYTMAEARAELFGVIEQTPNLTWQLLTKRPENMTRYAPAHWGHGWPANVWAGTSVENQRRADERIPHLLRVPASVRFLSAEPLLGPISLRGLRPGCYCAGYCESCDPPGCDGDCGGVSPGVQWVIVGGESGHQARHCNLDWVRHIVRQCQRAGVACFVKQMGGNPTEGRAYEGISEAHLIYQDAKGGDPDEWPADLRVRQFPGDAPPPAQPTLFPGQDEGPYHDRI